MFAQLEDIYGPENGYATKTLDIPVPDQVKNTVNVIFRSPLIEWHVRFTTVHLKTLINQV